MSNLFSDFYILCVVEGEKNPLPNFKIYRCQLYTFLYKCLDQKHFQYTILKYIIALYFGTDSAKPLPDHFKLSICWLVMASICVKVLPSIKTFVMDFEESLNLWKQERTFIRVNLEMMLHRGAILRTSFF